MKKVKKILFVFSLLVVVPNIVNAECEYNEKSKLQALSSNLNFTYNYKEIENGINSSASFSITIGNLNPNLYIVDQNNIRVVYYNNKKEITLNGYNPGSTIEFLIYGNSGECKGVEIMSNYITLPSYNRFYKDPVCNGVDDYKLCNRWSRVSLSYDDFVKKVNEYKEKIKPEELPNVEKELPLVEKIIKFLSKYSILLFGGIIVVCSVLMFYLNRKDDFDLN